MGRKGVSKRKPKKSGPNSGVGIGGSSNPRQGENSPVQLLVKDSGTGFNRGGANPAAGWNKNVRKGN